MQAREGDQGEVKASLKQLSSYSKIRSSRALHLSTFRIWLLTSCFCALKTSSTTARRFIVELNFRRRDENLTGVRNKELKKKRSRKLKKKAEQNSYVMALSKDQNLEMRGARK